MAKKTISKTQVKKGDKLATYYNSIDLRSWWESFATDTNANGLQKHKTIWSFIKIKTKVTWQQDFLWWLLGSKGDIAKDKAFERYTQLDWEHRRETGFWHSDSNIKGLEQEIKNKQTSLDAIKELGMVNLDLVVQIKNIIAQLNREYGGQLFDKNLTFKENKERISVFMKMHKDIAELLRMYQVMFAQSQGVDITNLSDFLAVFSGSMAGAGNAVAARKLGLAGNEESTIEGKSSAAKTMAAVTNMLMAKSANMEIPLPDPDIAPIILDANNPKPKLVRAR